ncbi:MAG: hypothetical protein Kow00108_04540 [Calditrichia bacterium]
MAAKEEKKSSKLLYILLAVVVAFFLYDSFTSDKSLVKLKKTGKQILNSINQEDKKFDKNTLMIELAKLNKFKNVAMNSEFKQNPFYKPIKRTVVTRKPKPGLIADIKQIIEGDPPYAEIDDQILTVGDFYKGWKIIEIKGNKVKFEKDGQTTTLSTNAGLRMMQ